MIEPTYPKIDTRQLSFSDLFEMNLTPLFQKDLARTWDDSTASKYIELLCLKFPLPPIYLGKSIEDTKVILGCQSIIVVAEFFGDQFSLTPSMDFLEELAGKKYSELKRHWQRRIWESKVIWVNTVENFDKLDYQSLGFGSRSLGVRTEILEGWSDRSK